MTLNKILIEINSRIKQLEDKKHKLIILEITREERLKRETILNDEIDKLVLMKHYCNK